MAREADAAVPEVDGADRGAVNREFNGGRGGRSAVSAAAVGACASTTWATAAAEGPWRSS